MENAGAPIAPVPAENVPDREATAPRTGALIAGIDEMAVIGPLETPAAPASVCAWVAASAINVASGQTGCACGDVCGVAEEIERVRPEFCFARDVCAAMSCAMALFRFASGVVRVKDHSSIDCVLPIDP